MGVISGIGKPCTSSSSSSSLAMVVVVTAAPRFLTLASHFLLYYLNFQLS
jgi:hypothetical protein